MDKDGAEVDKYRALRLIDGEEQGVAGSDEFGDFLTADTLPPTSLQPVSLATDQPTIQVKCLCACLRVLKTALETLDSIKDPQVLREIISSPKGQNYMQDLVEVYRVSERVRANTSQKGDLQSELEEVWKSLQVHLRDLQDKHMEDEEGAKCGICLSEVGPSHVRYGINNFHAPCANFYLHCVDPVLPIAPVML